MAISSHTNFSVTNSKQFSSNPLTLIWAESELIYLIASHLQEMMLKVLTLSQHILLSFLLIYKSILLLYADKYFSTLCAKGWGFKMGNITTKNGSPQKYLIWLINPTIIKFIQSNGQGIYLWILGLGFESQNVPQPLTPSSQKLQKIMPSQEKNYFC